MYYKTVIHVEVLSHEPIPPTMNLGDIVYQADSGDYSMMWWSDKESELDEGQLKQECEAHGTDVEFFTMGEYEEDQE